MKIGQQTVKEFTYDSAGRTTAVETSAGTTSLTYDYESRVTGITYPSQSTNSFTYNGLDTRVGMTDSGGSKTFLRDGVSVTSPVLSDGSADYTPAISERRSSSTTFYHAGIKNGDSQTSTGQSVTASIQYDAFGNVTSSSGTWQGPFAYGGPYGYQSDPDSGLKLLGHRYYDPSTGRFLTRDPIKDGRNWYGYCGGNPLKWADPQGLQSVSTPPGKAAIIQLWIEEARRAGAPFSQFLLSLGGAMQRHHVFPQEFRERFLRIFQDPTLIDRFTVELPQVFHEAIHAGKGGGWYNSRWKAFFEYYENVGVTPSPLETIHYMRKLRKELEIDDLKFVDYRDRK
ncbi:MAG: RHS repeat-associated core domain-containing protein [Fimbriimonadaceae bacterium]|nr:MAG: RHS repeat-associated core domain-containing protein [Fimbriimonadaceae bacterium]